MAYLVACKFCGHRVKAVNTLWGKTLPCKACGQSLRVDHSAVIDLAFSKKDRPCPQAYCPSCRREVPVVGDTCPLCANALHQRDSANDPELGYLGGNEATNQEPAHVLPRDGGARSLVHPTDSRASHKEQLQRRSRIFLGLTLFATVLLALVLSAIFYKQAESKKRRSEYAAKVEHVERRLASATQAIGRLDYKAAREALLDAETRIGELQLAMPDEYASIAKRLQDIQEERRVKERDYDAKVAKGYVVFEGELLTALEKSQRIHERELRQAEADRLRLEEEARIRAQHEAQRRKAEAEAEAKRRKEAIARASRRNREAFETSKEFVKEILKAPASARFPDYTESKVQVTFDPDTKRYTVLAWVDAQNPYGVFLRAHYVCELWPVSDRSWKAHSTMLLD